VVDLVVDGEVDVEGDAEVEEGDLVGVEGVDVAVEEEVEEVDLEGDVGDAVEEEDAEVDVVDAVAVKEVRRSSSRSTSTRVSSLHEAKKMCWSLVTVHQENQSTVKNVLR
jgi:hypothetical protein